MKVLLVRVVQRAGSHCTCVSESLKKRSEEAEADGSDMIEIHLDDRQRDCRFSVVTFVVRMLVSGRGDTHANRARARVSVNRSSVKSHAQADGRRVLAKQ